MSSEDSSRPAVPGASCTWTKALWSVSCQTQPDGDANIVKVVKARPWLTGSGQFKLIDLWNTAPIDKPGYIYVFTTTERAAKQGFKVGRSDRLNARLPEWQTCYPELRTEFHATTRMADLTDKLIHVELENTTGQKRKPQPCGCSKAEQHKEWFRVTSLDHLREVVTFWTNQVDVRRLVSTHRVLLFLLASLIFSLSGGRVRCSESNNRKNQRKDQRKDQNQDQTDNPA